MYKYICVYIYIKIYIYIYICIHKYAYVHEILSHMTPRKHRNLRICPNSLSESMKKQKISHVSRWSTPITKTSAYNESFQGPRVSKDRNDSWSLATDLSAITKAAILHLGSPTNLQSEPRRLPWHPHKKQTTRLGVRRLRPQQAKLLLGLVPLLLLERYLPSECTSRASTWTHPTR